MSTNEAFVHTEEVELNDGTKVKLPPLTLRKVLTLTQSVAKLVTKCKESLPEGVFNGEGSVVAFEVAKVLPTIVPAVIEELSEVLAKYLDITKDQILDSYTPEDLVAVATPFFVRITKSANVIIEKFNGMFPTAKVETTVILPQTESATVLNENLQP